MGLGSKIKKMLSQKPANMLSKVGESLPNLGMGHGRDLRRTTVGSRFVRPPQTILSGAGAKQWTKTATEKELAKHQAFLKKRKFGVGG